MTADDRMLLKDGRTYRPEGIRNVRVSWSDWADRWAIVIRGSVIGYAPTLRAGMAECEHRGVPVGSDWRGT